MSTETKSPNKPLTFLLAPDDRAELEQLAKSRERTVSAELRLAIAAYLAEARRVAA